MYDERMKLKFKLKLEEEHQFPAAESAPQMSSRLQMEKSQKAVQQPQPERGTSLENFHKNLQTPVINMPGT